VKTKGDGLLKTRLSAYRNPSRRGVEFYLTQTNGFGKHYIPKVAEMVEVEEGIAIEPAFILSDDDAQDFIDWLWENNFRPSGMGDASNSAQARHLADMQKIAFTLLGKLLEEGRKQDDHQI
jgi:hypothetical protein